MAIIHIITISFYPVRRCCYGV